MHFKRFPFLATYRRARIKAAEMDTSVSAFLADYAGQESEFERLEREEEEARKQVRNFRSSDRQPRDKLYER